MSDRWMSLSILTLAGAITIHAMAPAMAAPAQVPPAEPAAEPVQPAQPVQPVQPAVQPVPVAVPAAPVAAALPRPSCKPIRLGTAREVQNLLADMRDAGFSRVQPVGDLICGW